MAYKASQEPIPNLVLCHVFPPSSHAGLYVPCLGQSCSHLRALASADVFAYRSHHSYLSSFHEDFSSKPTSLGWSHSYPYLESFSLPQSPFIILCDSFYFISFTSAYNCFYITHLWSNLHLLGYK